MYLELHILQSFSATNLNRDDLNNPKETWFGGVRRARISSQALKRAVRTDPIFAETIKQRYSPRTQYLAQKIGEVLKDRHPEDEINEITQFFVGKFTPGESGETSKVLVFIGWEEINRIAEKLHEKWAELLAEARQPKAKKKDNEKEAKTPIVDGIKKQILKEIENSPVAPDIALFGRMLAGVSEFQREAACQVGHAISTHGVKVEMDFYTAMDDEKPDEKPGASMMGYIGYNSATYYRYALLDWKHLLADKNLGGDVALGKLTVEAFLRAMEAATLRGKKHSFDNNSRPAMMMAVVRAEKSPAWSLVNAFERPVRERNGSGFLLPSVAQLNQYWNNLIETYGDSSVKAVSICLLDPNLEPEAFEPNLSAAIASAQKENGKVVKPAFEVWVETVLAALTEKEPQQ
jgi:CRISPR system Cascade subunit CasC